MVTEAARVSTLNGYGIMDTPSEPRFDHLAREIARAFRVRSALISFIDHDRQWYKAKVGVAASEVPRSVSFCTHSIERDNVTVVLDASLDAHFSSSPFVTCAGGIRFYAAAPIRALNGARLGTVCIFEPTPRAEFPRKSCHQLASYAAQVNELLVQRRAALKPAA